MNSNPATSRYITEISGKLPHTNVEVKIPLNKKNLIVTGPNGSGKTSFLREMHKKLSAIIRERKLESLKDTKASLASAENTINDVVRNSADYRNLEIYIAGLKSQLDEIENGIFFNIEKDTEFSQRLFDGTAVLSFFEAGRYARINHAETAKGIESEKERFADTSETRKLGENLEQHLVNLKNRRSLALSEDNDLILSKQISDWFEHFEKNLKELMEDDSTTLAFNSGTLKFTISQKNKKPYTFQSLSYGYLAIFDIYADLLMQSEYFAVSPDELSGVVFIDEIDAHLHVSLQRLILPFFEKSFPSIQFIVSTHSPFVLTSVKDSITFDLGRNQAVDEDLSLFSYSSVMEGLLSTKTTSVILDETIKDLVTALSESPKDYEKLEKITSRIKPFEDQLDKRSRAFYLKGMNSLLDKD